jgi:hypothetical protein
MKAAGRQVAAAVAALVLGGAAAGCGEQEEKKGSHEIWFMGSVSDGATGEVIKEYEISLKYGTTNITGTVDTTTGRYTLGPLRAWNDYAVTISRPYYRAFVSYNAGIAPPTPPAASQQSDVYSANTTQTFNFDAYLFPESLQSPAVSISITKPDATAEPASGSIRLRPTSLPSIQDAQAGVGMQVWANDQDILANVLTGTFSGGAYVVDAGALVYGVTYQVAIFGVEGFQPVGPSTMLTVRAGFQESLTVPLTSTAAPLMITSHTIAQCRPAGQSTNVQSTAQITFRFNNSSVEDVTTAAGRGPEVLDNGLSVVTTMFGTLKPNALTTERERGTSFALSGDTLSIAWNPSAGLVAPSATDLIQSVTYSGLSSIMLQPSGRPDLVKSLAVLLNMSSILCAN